ncbi:saccharopine dehydrogenase family protein [Elongatibacter sediminis]|uniref:Saccharopine dehydrogenase NADP-binding domain-containing protein n=1 Tax=Elongatibacter sediminis TaxID=3119006 RepID=A0AAW9REV6_9GAMM
MSETRWMIYGANGYTGQLTAREAVRRGLRPILAGRNEAAVSRLAEELDLSHAVFDLDDAAAVRRELHGLRLVLHCAGPFSATSQPMIEACLAEGVHYLDITGEISVFENAHRQNDEARRADIVLIPGVGFDVVPSDCLAATLVRALPAATRLTLAFEAGGGPSPGTAKTSVEGLGRGGTVRRDGQLIRVPLAWRSRTIPFAHGERTAVTIPWGDVYTAHISTGVPDVEVYMAVPPATLRRLRRMRWLQPVLGWSPVQKFLKGRIERSVSGPSNERRGKTDAQLWGEVHSADGRTVSATMTTPNGYDLTVLASLGIAGYLLENEVEGGYYTPSLLMGADYASTLPGVTLELSPVN